MTTMHEPTTDDDRRAPRRHAARPAFRVRAPLAALLAAAATLLFVPPGPSLAASTDEAVEADAAEDESVADADPTDTDDASGPTVADGVVAGATECAAGDDFPTAVVADYVLGCMAANGNSYEALQQCSCSIDFIKARMDYKSYEQAGTVLQVQRDVGQRGIFYRDSNWAKSRVDRLEALQAESTLRCF